MATVRITKQFNFEMAHALMGHDGPCRYIHGHSYELSVTVSGIPSADKESPELGMVMDFSRLKKIVREHVIEHFDHALVLNKNSIPEDDGQNKEMFGKLILVDYQPTSENLLLDFVARIRPLMPPSVRLHSMKLRETMTSSAEWYAEENEGV